MGYLGAVRVIQASMLSALSPFDTAHRATCARKDDLKSGYSDFFLFVFFLNKLLKMVNGVI